MSDPLRTDSPRALDAASDAERDAKIEQLLLVGLDHYFAAEYDRAISVWTRALFLDRSHARAHAYIERARSALAEKQRESEELLQNGVAAFDRGEGSEARRLLEAAIDQGAPSDQALVVLDRLTRLEHGTVPPQPARAVRGGRVVPRLAAADRQGGPTSARSLAWMAAGVMVAVTAFVVAGAPRVEWRLMLSPQSVPADAPGPRNSGEAGLPLPQRGETALARARSFAASGRLHDALRTLEEVRQTDAQKPDADRLRADIQRQLLALAGAGSPAPTRRGGAAGRLP